MTLYNLMFLRISAIDVAIGHNLKVKMISAGNEELFTSDQKVLIFSFKYEKKKMFYK